VVDDTLQVLAEAERSHRKARCSQPSGQYPFDDHPEVTVSMRQTLSQTRKLIRLLCKRADALNDKIREFPY
jgi:hypothetical protein